MQTSTEFKLSDQEAIQDMLTSEKAITGNYSTCLLESKTPAVKRCFSSILSNQYKMQEELFGMMHQKGWYPVETAEEKKIADTKQKFSSSVTG